MSKGRALESEPRAAWIWTNQTSALHIKVKVPACVPRRWSDTVQSGNSLGGGSTNFCMVDLSSRRITKNLPLAKALTGNRAAKHILCVTYMWKAWGGDRLTTRVLVFLFIFLELTCLGWSLSGSSWGLYSIEWDEAWRDGTADKSTASDDFQPYVTTVPDDPTPLASEGAHT